MSQAIYRKWRPQRFADVIGQEHVTTTLQRAIISGRIGHAYLFCGPRGTGKTTSARLLAKAVNCRHEDLAERPCNECSVCKSVNDGRFLDLIEIDAASNTGVDDIRDLRDKINFTPNDGEYKVYIIDEVHMLSTAAFNALLKTLEEPPSHAIFVLATTEEHKILPTIKSRCQQYNFRLLTQVEIVSRLQWLAEQENLYVEPEAIQLIAREGAGSLRDAESLLDQLVTSPEDHITLERTQQMLGTASDTVILQLVDAWLEQNSQKGIQIIHSALEVGTDSRQFCRQMVVHLRRLLLAKTGSLEGNDELPVAQLAQITEQAKRAAYQPLIQFLKRFHSAAVNPGSHWQPQLALELAFLESLKQPAMEVVEVVQPRPTIPPSTTQVATPIAPQPVATPAPVAVAPAIIDPVTPPPSTVRLTIQLVQSAWEQIKLGCKQTDRNLASLLNQSTPLGIEGDTIVIGFQYPILKEKFESRPNSLRNVVQVASKIVGTKCIVRAVITSEYETQVISESEINALAQELGGVVKKQK